MIAKLEKAVAWAKRQAGWRGALLNAVAGALFTLCFAPFSLFVFIVPSLCVFYCQLQSAERLRQGFWRGWFYGFGFFLGGTYWISNALLVDAEQFAWLLPFSLLGLTGGLALFFALMGAAYVWIRTKVKADSIFLFAGLLSLTEWLRSTILTGFPWNLSGYASAGLPGLDLGVSYIGVFGLGLLLMFWAVSLLCSKRWWHVAVWAVLPIVVAMILPHLRSYETRPLGMTARVVQPNISQSLKWEPAYMAQTMRRLVSLSSKAGLERIDLVVWPETAIPYTVYADSEWLADTVSFLSEGQYLLTGAVYSEDEAFWNSMLLINHLGEIVARYDKQHLVPFGEYVPLSEYLPMDRIAPGIGAFSLGEQPREFTAPSLPKLHGLICYEIVYPQYANTNADLMINLTNDAWFGDSLGPYQHAEMTRFRAIEQGVTVLRAANTGVSAIYMPDGRLAYTTKLGETLAFDVEVMGAKSSKTMYRFFGNTTYWYLLILCGLGMVRRNMYVTRP